MVPLPSLSVPHPLFAHFIRPTYPRHQKAQLNLEHLPDTFHAILVSVPVAKSVQSREPPLCAALTLCLNLAHCERVISVLVSLYDCAAPLCLSVSVFSEATQLNLSAAYTSHRALYEQPVLLTWCILFFVQMQPILLTLQTELANLHIRKHDCAAKQPPFTADYCAVGLAGPQRESKGEQGGGEFQQARGLVDISYHFPVYISTADVTINTC